MKKLICFIVCAAMLLGCCVFATAEQEKDALQFGSDGKFTVLQITDPQDDHSRQRLFLFNEINPFRDL